MTLNRQLIVLAVLSVAAVAGFFAFGGKDLIGRYFEAPPDQAALESVIFAKLNEHRSAVGLPALERDREIEAWVQSRFIAKADVLPDTARLLDDLSENEPSLLSLSANVVRATGPEELLKEALIAQDSMLDEATTHIASVVHIKESSRSLASIVITARRLPKFSPKMLSRNGAEFFNECILCGEGHTGKIIRANRAVVLTCPHCDRDYDLLAMKVDGTYSRVTDLLRAYEPPTAYKEERDIHNEAVDIWAAIGRHCSYVKDKFTPEGQEDAWQTSRETMRFGNGDCEDSSILLCDWMLSRGIEARVAVGEHREAGGHAWVVAKIGGMEHILETTTASAGRFKLPEIKSVGRDYYPNFLFDHDAIYFRRKQGWTSEYWSAKEWRRVVHERHGAVALDKQIANRIASDPSLLEAAFE